MNKDFLKPPPIYWDKLNSNNAEQCNDRGPRIIHTMDGEEEENALPYVVYCIIITITLVLFISLKLVDGIDWRWRWVLSPLWISFLLHPIAKVFLIHKKNK